MKKSYLKISLALLLSIFLRYSATAQMDNVTQILNGGLGDANKLMNAYMEPYGKGFALGLANGWYNTAKPHKLLGFDLTITGGVGMVPSDLKTYDISKIGLTTLTFGANTEAPTIAGEETNGPDVYLKMQDNASSISYTDTISLPQGTGFGYVPSAMAQLGLGLPFGTELDVRFLPSVKLGKTGKIGLWGLGIKHDIKQWIPVIKEIPFWSMSALVAYTSFKTSTSGTLLKPSADQYYLDGVDMNNYNGQGVELTASAFTAGIIASTDIPIINVYGGLGFTSASSKLKLTGIYPLPTLPTPAQVINSGDPLHPKSAVLDKKDPIDLDFDSNMTYKANIGLRLKLLLFTFHADATLTGGYTFYTGGFGISFR